MKRDKILIFPIFILLLFIYSCATPSYTGSGGDSQVYENDNKSQIVTTNSTTASVKGLTFLLSLKVKDLTTDTYIVTDQIKSLEIKLNNKKIGSFASYKYDIDNVEKVNKSNYYTRLDKFYYQVDIKIVDFSV
ncbi:MAG TPA: hypothetical protein PK771_15455, partial [Spirochaetota bacterium]|nr:hypothetical protein [Spirochaetota bacterium]